MVTRILLIVLVCAGLGSCRTSGGEILMGSKFFDNTPTPEAIPTPAEERGNDDY